MHNKRLRDKRLRNKGLKDDYDHLVYDDLTSDNEWFIDDETDLSLSDLQLENLSVDVLRGEVDQAGTSTSITPHTSTSTAAQQANKDISLLCTSIIYLDMRISIDCLHKKNASARMGLDKLSEVKKLTGQAFSIVVSLPTGRHLIASFVNHLTILAQQIIKHIVVIITIGALEQ
ncbi:hypothetical protein M5K25_010907 [Dendrobium thyrsiflorum]|uniref:Uncharacterized protein n=1 Tax=Dendrobium thyrsiflorum TaxID=117978 RepID=A0ABD0V2H8_DENTH